VSKTAVRAAGGALAVLVGVGVGVATNGVVGVLVVAGVAAALILVPAKGDGQDGKGTSSPAAGPLSNSAPALLAAVEVPADTRECDNAWSDSDHQTLTGGSKVGVTLQAPVGQTIVLRELGVQVMRTSAPITNRPEPTEDGCGGVTDQRWFTVRLRDRTNATVLDTTNAKADPATAGTLPLTIKNDEPEQLYFRLDASAYTYEFRIVMRLASDGTSYTQTLDNGGRPFRVTPDPRPAK